MKILFVLFRQKERARMDDGMETGILPYLVENGRPDWANIKYEKPDFPGYSLITAPKKLNQCKA